MNPDLSIQNHFHPEFINAKPHFDFKGTVRRYFFHWPLYVLLISLMVAGAYFFNIYLKPVYVVTAKVLIKETQDKTKEEIALKEVNQTEDDDSRGVETEMEILKSRPIVQRVVNDLQLWVKYQQKGEYVDDDLYAQSPVRFTLVKAGMLLNQQAIEIIIKNADQFLIKGSDQKTSLFNFKNTLSSSFGAWRLDTTGTLKNFVGKTIIVTLQNPDKALAYYQKNIKAVNLDKTVPVINLSVEDVVPERGKDILNTLIAEYHKETSLKKRETTKKTLDFIDTRLASLTGELTGVEKNFEHFKSDRGITDIAANSQADLNNFQTNDSRINDINLQLEVINGIENYANSESGSENPPVTIGINDMELTNLVGQLTQLQLERNRLLANSPEKNPIFIPINKQIKTAKEVLKSDIAGIKASLLAMKKQLMNNNSKVESTIKSVPGQERELISIKRQQEIKENLYIYLLQKREEIGLDYASTLPVASTIEAANYSGVKTSQSLILSIAVLLGLLFPTGIIYGRDVLNSTIISKNEILNAVDAPVICEIMMDENSTPDLILNKKRYVIGEQFRDLRTKLNSLFEKSQKGRVTLFTSSIGSEGKSFVASNLAITLAAAGRKTMLLELDMRLPKIAERLNLDMDHAGISDYLSDDALISSIIQKTAIHPNLDVISTHVVPDNPTELLESDKMVILIEVLKQHYDYILVDSPPTHLVPDAMILANLCDVTLFIVRQAFTPRKELEFINTVFLEERLPNVYIVLNCVQKAGRYIYGYDFKDNYYAKASNKSFKQHVKEFLSRF